MVWKRRRRMAQEADGSQDASSLELRNNAPLVPPDTIAGRALVTVVAIMTFLASLAIGGAVLIDGAAQSWSRTISEELTIQLLPADGRDLDADVKAAAAIAKATAGIADVRIYSSDEAARMLEPWLGAGLDLSELPVPRLIALRRASNQSLDEAALGRALSAAVPSAQLDDHAGWTSRLNLMARSFVFLAIVVLALVLIAMAMAVGFATRGAMAGSREIIDVLHFVGAEDRYVTLQFQTHFMKLGFRGGLIGGSFAVLAFFTSSAASSMWTGSAAGEQMQAMFGVFSLGWFGYAAIAALAVGISLLTGIVSRTIVFKHLRSLT